MTLKKIWQLAQKAVNGWIEDYAPSMGAALAYYTLFSIAPVLLIVIAIAGLVFGQEAAQGEIVAQLQGLLGEEGAIAVQALLESASEPTQGLLATIGSIAALIVGATSVFGELQTDLDRIWRAPAKEKKSGIWNLLRTRLLSFGMVLTIGFLLLMSLVLSAALSALGRWWGGFFDSWEIALQALNFVISFGVITGLFAAIYKLLPSAKISWHDVWIGSAVTALLFVIGKFLIGLYIGKSGVASGFGAAGSFVVLLVWVYYSTQIFLLGAEFTWVYSNKYGSAAAAHKEGKANPLGVSAAEAVSAPHRLQAGTGTIVFPAPHHNVAATAQAYVSTRPIQTLGIVAATGMALGAMLRFFTAPHSQRLEKGRKGVRDGVDLKR